MQATRADIFALKTSGLDAFLYADVGAEVNGSTLTILSILARLGKDPWAEAARWAALPKGAVIDSLAQSIAEMPLAPSVLAGARDTATRLVQLLPTAPRKIWHGSAVNPATGARKKLVPIAILYFALVVGMALNLLLIPERPITIAAPGDQMAARSLPAGTAVASAPVARATR